MADALALNDIVQITLIGSYDDQVFQNVLHFKAENPPDPANTYIQGIEGLIAAIKNDVVTGIVDSALPLMGPNGGFDKIRGQKVYPTREHYVDVVEAQAGTNGTDVTTGNLAMVITKQSSRAGRGRSGSFHLFGVPNDQYLGSRFLAAYLTLADTLAAQLASTQRTFGGFPVWFPGMYNGAVGTPANWSNIVLCSPQDTVRVMRRRTLRVGI